MPRTRMESPTSEIMTLLQPEAEVIANLLRIAATADNIPNRDRHEMIAWSNTLVAETGAIPRSGMMGLQGDLFGVENNGAA